MRFVLLPSPRAILQLILLHPSITSEGDTLPGDVCWPCLRCNAFLRQSCSRKLIHVNHTQSCRLDVTGARVEECLPHGFGYGTDSVLRKTWIHFQATSKLLFSEQDPASGNL